MAGQLSLVRQWLLLKSLGASRHGLTVRQLAAELEVCDKTIRRDLALFRQVGFPLAETIAANGRKKYRLEFPCGPGLSFTFEEALALYLGRRMLDPLLGTIMHETAQQAFRKIRSALGEQALGYLNRMAAVFCQSGQLAGDYRNQREMLDQLLIALEDRRVVCITYRSQKAERPSSYPVHPLGIQNHRGALYVIGFGVKQNEIRTWKLQRIEAAELTAETFTPPAGFELHDFVRDSLGAWHGKEEVKVKIRFAPEAARYVEETEIHPSRKITPQPDGGLIAQFDLSSTEEIKAWTLGFGSQAEILAPKSLRDDVRRELGKTLRRYGASVDSAGVPRIPGERKKA